MHLPCLQVQRSGEVGGQGRGAASQVELRALDDRPGEFSTRGKGKEGEREGPRLGLAQSEMRDKTDNA